MALGLLLVTRRGSIYTSYNDWVNALLRKTGEVDKNRKLDLTFQSSPDSSPNPFQVIVLFIH